jgi:hypothetical protein
VVVLVSAERQMPQGRTPERVYRDARWKAPGVYRVLGRCATRDADRVSLRRQDQASRDAFLRGADEAAGLMAKGQRPADADALLEALELTRRHAERSGPLAIRNTARQGGLDQSSTGQLLPAHRESLHRATTLSRSSYPTTFSCSSSTGSLRQLTNDQPTSSLDPPSRP